MPIIGKHSRARVNNVSPAANAIKSKLWGRYLTIDELSAELPQYSKSTLKEALCELLYRKRVRVSHWALTGKKLGRRKVYASNKAPRYA